MPRVDPAHHDARLTELYQAGRTYTEIVRELHISRATLIQRVEMLIESGALTPRPGMRGPYRRPEGQAERVAELYAGGATWAEAGEALGISHETARTRLHTAGVRPSRRTPRWEAAQGWPWPLTLEEVALRLYGEHDAGARRRAGSVVGNWVRLGFLVRVGWARYGRRPENWEDDPAPP